MKFLWIFTTAITTFFAYHTYTHTRIRYKDLESVMQQNLAVEKGLGIRKQVIKKKLTEYKQQVEDYYAQGQNNLEIAIVIQKYADSLNIDSIIPLKTNKDLSNKGSLGTQNIVLLNKYSLQLSNLIANKMRNDILVSTSILKEPDTSSIVNLRASYFSSLKDEIHYYPFLQQKTLTIQTDFVGITYMGVDYFARVGVIICTWEKIIAMAVPKSRIVKSGEKYKANIILVGSSRGTKVKSMRSTEGSLNIKGYVGEIEIPNVKAQSYNSEGKATKTLTGKITIKKADGSDTTFTLSTSYTVKKLVN
jgi:hypothetical protein